MCERHDKKTDILVCCCNSCILQYSNQSLESPRNEFNPTYKEDIQSVLSHVLNVKIFILKWRQRFRKFNTLTIALALGATQAGISNILTCKSDIPKEFLQGFYDNKWMSFQIYSS